MFLVPSLMCFVVPRPVKGEASDSFEEHNPTPFDNLPGTTTTPGVLNQQPEMERVSETR